MKKIVFSLFIMLCISIYTASSIAVESSNPNKYYIEVESRNLKNNTEGPIKIVQTREINCPGEPLQITTVLTTLERGQTGLVFIKGGTAETCIQHVTELKIVAPGLEPATIANPDGITAKDYVVSLKATEASGQKPPGKKIVIE